MFNKAVLCSNAVLTEGFCGLPTTKYVLSASFAEFKAVSKHLNALTECGQLVLKLFQQPSGSHCRYLQLILSHN